MTESKLVDDAFTVRPLAPATWDAFADLAERHNGVWGGCWCTWFHTMHAEKEYDADANRALKKRLVREGRAHAALVFDGNVAVAWCQFGSPQELPNIKHRKEYEAELDNLPDYRLTCFFVDKRYRRRGVSALALQGALDLIARAGGGVVEAYPRTPAARRSRHRSSTASPAASSSRPASATCVRRERTTPLCARRSRTRGSPAPATAERWLPVR